jgi:hypothetical protein
MQPMMGHSGGLLGEGVLALNGSRRRLRPGWANG